MAAGVVLALAGVTGIGTWIARQDRQGESRSATDTANSIAELPSSGQTALSELGPPPFIEELPQALEESRHPAFGESTQFVAPIGPKVAWKARFVVADTHDLHVVGVGPEGTVYMMGYSPNGHALCAMRDGRLTWGFHDVSGDFFMAPDGRVWVIDASSDGSTREAYCFNNRGQGGRLPKSVKPPPRPHPRYVTTLASMFARAPKPVLVGAGYSCSIANEPNLAEAPERPGLLGRPWGGGGTWFVPLGQYCNSSSPAIGVDGDAYLVTVAKFIYRISPQGQVRWNAAAPCAPAKLYPLASGDVLFYCGADLYRIHDGTLQWKAATGHNILSNILIDRAETVCAMEDFNGGFMYQPTSHVTAVNAAGQRVWALTLEKFKAGALFLDAAGRLYLTGECNKGSWGVICLRQ